MSNLEGLDPCPNCGNPNAYIDEAKYFNLIYGIAPPKYLEVICPGCAHRSGIHFDKTKIIDGWNHRHEVPELLRIITLQQERIEELEGELRHYAYS